jgi:CO/xanthine dehydrogenase FAD-binding subunit
MSHYLRPRELSEALAALSAGPHTILAGGTDHFPARVERAPEENLLDISGLAELRGIEVTPRHFRIGAGVTWTDLIRAELPACFDGLKLAAREVGGMQIQNAGTIAGNLCNASPAADGLPNLLALDAAVDLASVDGRRRLPVGAFVAGNRKTRRRPEELVTAILVPRAIEDARSTFLKLGAREYLVISIVMVAVVLDIDRDRIRSARIAVGACSEVACRLEALEQVLAGRVLGPSLGAAVEAVHMAPLTPIDDIRASAAYRRQAALVLVRRALDGLGALR